MLKKWKTKYAKYSIENRWTRGGRYMKRLKQKKLEQIVKIVEAVVANVVTERLSEQIHILVQQEIRKEIKENAPVLNQVERAQKMVDNIFEAHKEVIEAATTIVEESEDIKEEEDTLSV